MNFKPAEYRCQRCKQEWSGKPGPVECPVCGHDYIDWLNYERDFARRIDN